MIKVNNLTYNYKNQETKVFEKANIELDKGLWLLEGDNGTGKSTLLKIITGSYINEGEISEDTTIDIQGNIIFLDDSTSLPLGLKELDIAEYIFKINDISLGSRYEPLYKDKALAMYSVGERKMATLKILSYLNIDMLIINVGIFLIEFPNTSVRTPEYLFSIGAFRKKVIVNLSGLYRLFSCQFIHAGIFHLFFNIESIIFATILTFLPGVSIAMHLAGLVVGAVATVLLDYKGMSKL